MTKVPRWLKENSINYCRMQDCEGKLAKKSESKASEEATNLAGDNPEIMKQIAEMRMRIRETFGKVVMAMMGLPRYRSQTIADLQHLVLEPLIRDRVSIAYPTEQKENPLTDVAGMAIWASVSEEVDAKIREQIKAGVFPVRLGTDEWDSGEINWLLDVIAPDRKTTASVIANFKQVVKDGDLRMHPIITRLLDKETLEKLGAVAQADA
ncbi:toxin-activating lysine-acyltransferase [Ruegeria sp. Ofav3-42]|uniref:toxin-activating lysine-acyltransferase n=1 Tax=Ruegeria sp. Ofav3-42 TaxID=2917759 RepID=UPI001EF5C228|nr:toxin-activating lysine-acyltransferase [Ruegeria sp. Ofav3-42]MCG7521936.1 toxin-activating lysine-acyltransferase [Ruegeria sp. Ofav3-42]